MLATLDTRVPHGDDWAHEVKFDGYRAIAYVRGGECRLVSRNDNDLTGRFPDVAKAIVKAVKSPNAVVDGEVCRARPDRAGRASPSCSRARGRSSTTRSTCSSSTASRSSTLPLRERKDRLRELLDGATRQRRRTRRTSRTATRCFAVAQEQHFEGIIAKRARAAYKQGKRTRDWLKLKTENSEEFVVAGYTRGAGRRAGTFGSLVLARQRRRRAALRRQRRHRLQRRRDPQAAEAAEAAAPRDLAVPGRAEDAARAQGRRPVGRPASSSRRCASASGRTTGTSAIPPTSGIREDKEPARRRVRPASLPSTAGRDPQGQAGAEALEPRQALLARRGDHEGRPAATTTRRLPTCSSRT